ncbi:MAG: sulfite exporter TauE/SafE family protein [Rhodobacteraceae bacterium]|nr:sulfite exporter TauE/SafE family protein [Paracoccaceae bacterium]
MSTEFLGWLRELITPVDHVSLMWLIAGAVFAGIIRGFSGFGTAMIYLPFAASQISPIWALTSMVIMDLIGPMTLLPKTLKDTYKPDLAMLGVGALIACPFGVWLLVLLEPEFFRYLVSILTLILLVLLIGNLRYKGKLSNVAIVGTGGLGGFLSGIAGLPGPPVIMLYLASSLPPLVIRANLFVYLIMADVLLLVIFGSRGFLDAGAIGIGLIVAVPYLIALWVGTMIFNPNKEKQYRMVAYLVIAFSALRGLPIW